MKDKEENRRYTCVWQGFLTQYFAVRTSRKIQELIGGAILISWKFAPSMVRIEPFSRKYHYHPAFIALQRAALHFEMSYLSQAYDFLGCQILVRHRINVFLLLIFCFQAAVQELIFPYINIAHETGYSHQLTLIFQRFLQSNMKLSVVVLIILTKSSVVNILIPCTYRMLFS